MASPKTPKPLRPATNVPLWFIALFAISFGINVALGLFVFGTKTTTVFLENEAATDSATTNASLPRPTLNLDADEEARRADVANDIRTGWVLITQDRPAFSRGINPRDNVVIRANFADKTSCEEQVRAYELHQVHAAFDCLPWVGSPASATR